MKMYRKLRVALRPLKRAYNWAKVRLMELPYRIRKPAKGSAKWLIHAEVVYGGLQTGVMRNKVSPCDSRTQEQLRHGGMSGGDRMLHHGYATVYALYLSPFLDEKTLTLAEFGILKGTGLAIWCDLFPNSRVLGFDIDLEHFQKNRSSLARRGAFRLNAPDLYEYDQLLDGQNVLMEALQGQKLDIVIDDGLHSIEAIKRTWYSVKPYLSSRFVYIIEDFPFLLDQCGDTFSGYKCNAFGEITVIQAG